MAWFGKADNENNITIRPRNSVDIYNPTQDFTVECIHTDGYGKNVNPQGSSRVLVLYDEDYNVKDVNINSTKEEDNWLLNYNIKLDNLGNIMRDKDLSFFKLKFGG